MKVSPLVTNNKYDVLTVEETQDTALRPVNPLTVTCYIICFITKLCCLQSPMVPKHGKYFIRSAQTEKEMLLTVGLKTVDTHVMIDVEALLDSVRATPNPTPVDTRAGSTRR